ncbi:MAG TPA: DNA gyrase subunit A, partial [Methylomirabilota bacterium]|nr:DNA gyrase subunit A [Methylomirabilota bacterium]
MKTAQFVERTGLDFLTVKPGSKAGLARRDTAWMGTPEMRELGEEELKKHAKHYLQECREELAEIQEKYGDARRTEITAAVEDIETEDLIVEEDMVVTVSHQGYVKR